MFHGKHTMTRDAAIARATEAFDSGAFLALLREAVAMPTESQAPGQEAALRAYLESFIAPLVSRLGFETPKSSRTRTGCTARS